MSSKEELKKELKKELKEEIKKELKEEEKKEAELAKKKEKIQTERIGKNFLKKDKGNITHKDSMRFIIKP